MSTATLAGLRVVGATVTLPRWGVWYADVAIDVASTLSGRVTLALAGLALEGTITRGEAWHGATRYRIVGGAAGWSRELAPKAYRSPAGVRLALVAREAASEAGESLDIAPGEDRSLGAAFVRPTGPAWRVLELVSPREWYVDVDGRTRIGARPTGVVGSRYDVIDVDAARRWALLAAEDTSSLVPGRSVIVGLASPVEASTVVHHLASHQLRTEVWA